MEPVNDELRIDRRGLLRWAGRAGLASLLSPLVARPGWTAEPRARALIVLWLEGGPSQLETFDPHPGSPIMGPTRAIETALPGVRFAGGLPRLAERADRLAVVRSLVTDEPEHQRARYRVRTGAKLTPTVVHPAVSAAVAHEVPRAGLDLPPHVALLSQRPPRGGYLGSAWNAFAVRDPEQLRRKAARAFEGERVDRRLDDLAFLEGEFAAGHPDAAAADHADLATRAIRMVRSPQAEAFDASDEPEAVRARYGETPFGRACLVARRLVEVGVPAVEVTLPGWDSHTSNFEVQGRLSAVLDRAFAALLDDLAERGLDDEVIVLCVGEMGRTPKVNALDGRDHWTQGSRPSWPAAASGAGS